MILTCNSPVTAACYPSGMAAEHSPTITSFVIRFIVEEAEEALAASPYRGSIRHVQSDQTLNFSAWQDAVEFIRRFVPLEPQAEE